jgi:ABC-type Fe3+-siderophore transport system permease subunit
MSENNIDFSFEFAVSMIITLVVTSGMIKKNPDMSTIVVVISGLVISYISLVIVNFLFPQINKVAGNVWQYIIYSLMTNFNNLGYLHVWPPIFAVLIIMVVLLYNRNLG